MNKKIAILGGAFDPTTIAHIQIMEAVSKDCYGFDEVWAMPCFQHKFGKNMTSVHKRVSILAHSIYSYNKLHNNILKKVHTSYFEVNYEITGGTYVLLQELKKRYPDCNFSFVIGMDNAINFNKWVSYERLIKEANFLVIPRQGVTNQCNDNWWTKEGHKELKEELPQISSTEVRELFARSYNNSCNEEQTNKLINSLVDTYDMIVKDGLYRE
jgi:nicotinate-nucleotide adenylyltransferase